MLNAPNTCALKMKASTGGGEEGKGGGEGKTPVTAPTVISATVKKAAEGTSRTSHS